MTVQRHAIPGEGLTYEKAQLLNLIWGVLENVAFQPRVRTRVQIRSFALSVLLLRRTSNGRKLLRRCGGQRFLSKGEQHRSRLIARTFERELGIGFFNTVPPPLPCLKAARINHLAALFLCNLQKPQTCWSDVCVVCTDHAAGSSSSSASATAAVACTLPGE